MKKLTAKILLISDPHFSINSEKSEEKWFPPVCDFLEKWVSPKAVKVFLKFWDYITRRAFEYLLEKAKTFEPYDLAIGLGDYTPGANEKGMLTKKTRFQYIYFSNLFHNKIKCLKKLVWGDQDIGYRFKVGEKVGIKIGTEKGGVSIESIQMATEFIGPPFESFSVKGLNFIFIATNLIRNVDKSSNKRLQELKLEQENFLAKTLNSQKGKAFLLLHDPTTLTKETSTRKIIDSHCGKITAIIHGHLHTEFSRFFARRSPTYGKLCREYKTILVPASWGIMGIGGGFLIMNVYNDGTYNIEKRKV